MPNLEIDRYAVTIDTTPSIDQYGWVVRGVVTFYSLPFRSRGEQDRFVHLLAGHVAATTLADEVDTLAALLCLSRGQDEAAYACAAGYLDRVYASVLDAWPLGELDDLVDRLLVIVRDERLEVGQ